MTTMYKMRKLLYEKQKKELSESKTMHVLIHYLPDFCQAFRGDLIAIENLLDRIFNLLKRNALKSRRGTKKTSMDILSPFIR